MFRTGFVGRQFPAGLGAGTASGASASLDLNLMGPTLDPRITFTRASSATYFDSSGTMQTAAAANTPRFDYDPLSLQQKGLLIEESRTNILLNSKDLAIGSWGGPGTTRTFNALAGMDGTVTAVSCVEDTSTGEHYHQTTVTTAAANAAYAFSAYVKLIAGKQYVNLIMFDNTAPANASSMRFDLINLAMVPSVAGTGSSPTGTIQKLPNGWFRVSMAAQPSTVANTGVIFRLRLLDNSGNSSYTGSGTDGAYWWGAQAEAGTSPTSYIPTTASAVTRAADIVWMPLSSWYNQAAGSFDVEFIPLQAAQSGTQSGVLRWDDVTNNNSAGIFVNSSSNVVASATVATVSQANSVPGNPVFGTINRVIMVYGDAAWRSQLNGGASFNGSGSAVCQTMSRLIIGSTHLGLGGAWTLTGYVRRVKYWPRALAASDMVAENSVPSLDIDLRAPTLDPRITFTRASSGSYFDSTGTLTQAAYNLVLQSADYSNAAWSKLGSATAPIVTANQAVAPDGSMTAASIIYPAVSGGGAYSRVGQSISITANVHTYSVYLRGAVGGEQLYIYTTADTINYYRQLVTLTTTWQRLSLTTGSMLATSYGFHIGVDLRDASQSSKGAQTIYAWGGQLEQYTSATNYVPTTTVAAGAPRLDYDPVTLQPRGLLVEEARTNSIRNGNATGAVIGGAFPTFWGTQPLAGISSTVVGVGIEHGVGYVDIRVQGNGGPTVGNHFIAFEGNVTVADPQSWTFSLYFRVVGGSLANISFALLAAFAGGGSNGFVTGIIPATSGDTLQTRYQCIGTTAAGSISIRPYLQINCRNDVDVTLRFMMPQLEVGAFPTSYIPTSGAAATRALDNATMLAGPWLNQVAISLAGDFMIGQTPNPNSVSGRDIATLNDGTSNNRAGVRAQVASSANAAYMTGVSGTVTASGAVFIPAINVTQKIAATWVSGAQTAAGNGGAVVSSSVAGIAAGINALSIGNTTAGAGNVLNGYVQRVRVWPRVLSNAELQAVTR